MVVPEYKPVASGSDDGSRDASLETKRNDARAESYENGGEGKGPSIWSRAWFTFRRLRRGNIFTAAVVAVLFITASKAIWGRPPPPVETKIAPPDPEYNRIAKVSMLFGNPSKAYDRALESHERHAVRWGYPFYVLRRDEGCGFWTKLVYLMSILGLELQKDPEERAEWLMWADADSVILNPNIPISIFLPPPSIPHVHFVGTKDWNGLNNGVFFLRVHPWSVSMLTSAMSFPLCHQDVDLGANVEQEGMRLTFARPSGGQGDLGWRSGVVYMPKVWFNTYEMAMGDMEGWRESNKDKTPSYPGLKMPHYYEGRRGDMLVHCPGVGHEFRQDLMNDWMDLVENEYSMQFGSLNASRVLNETQYVNRTLEWEQRVNASSSHIWSLPLSQTNYSSLTTGFWERYREGMDAVLAAGRHGSGDIKIAEAALSLRVALSEEAENEVKIGGLIETLREMMEEEDG